MRAFRRCPGGLAPVVSSRRVGIVCVFVLALWLIYSADYAISNLTNHRRRVEHAPGDQGQEESEDQKRGRRTEDGVEEARQKLEERRLKEEKAGVRMEEPLSMAEARREEEEAGGHKIQSQVDLRRNEVQGEQSRISMLNVWRSGFLNIIMQYPVLKEQLDAIVSEKGARVKSAALREARIKREKRQSEYTDALMANLVHPAVERVYLMTQQDEDEAFIVEQLKNHQNADHYVKLIIKGTGDEFPSGTTAANELLWSLISETERIRFVKLRRQLLYSDAFSFARMQLPGRACIIQNADISLSLEPKHINSYLSLATAVNHSDEARPRLTPAQWTSREGRKKAFVISRSNMAQPFCGRTSSDCTNGALLGSYDTFIFESPLPEKLEWQVPMPQNVYGAENRVLWTMKCLNISVTNPCLLLATSHHHCDNTYRPGQQKDPPNLPPVQYDGHVELSYPPFFPAETIRMAMTSSKFPGPDVCRYSSWNGPEAISEEALAAARSFSPSS